MSWVKSLCRTTGLRSARANSSQMRSSASLSFPSVSVHRWFYFSDKDFMPLHFDRAMQNGPAPLQVPPGRSAPQEAAHRGEAAVPAAPPSGRAGAAHPTSCLGTLCIALADGVRGWNTHKATPSSLQQPAGSALLPRRCRARPCGQGDALLTWRPGFAKPDFAIS